MRRISHILSLALLLLIIPLAAGATGGDTLEEKLEKLRHIKNMPDYPEYSGDPEFWEVVKEGKAAIVPLIDMMDDAAVVDAEIPFSYGDTSVGDVALIALMRIVADLPVLDCIPGESNSGFGKYWFHIRKDPSNRKGLQQKIRKWYERNAGRLTWVEDLTVMKPGVHRGVPMQHPAKGYYLTGSSSCEADLATHDFAVDLQEGFRGQRVTVMLDLRPILIAVNAVSDPVLDLAGSVYMRVDEGAHKLRVHVDYLLVIEKEIRVNGNTYIGVRRGPLGIIRYEVSVKPFLYD